MSLRAVSTSAVGFNDVQSVTGTANQVTASPTTGNVTVSTPSDFRPPGTVQVLGDSVVSLPSEWLSGALFTGGSGTSTMPQFLIRQTATSAVSTWNTGGTYIGVNAVTGFAGNFIDVHTAGGTSLFRVSSDGTVVTAGNVTIGSTGQLSGAGSSVLITPANGTWRMTNNAGTAFTALSLGPSGTTYIQLRPDGAGSLSVRLADNSADAALVASTVRLTASTTVAALPSAAAGNTGMRRFVSDGAAVPVFGAIAVGGGALFLPVFSDGTNWRNG